MTKPRKITEEDLPQWQEARVAAAVTLLIGSAALGLADMTALLTPGEIVPLPGMDRLGGQLGWAAVAGGMLLLAARFARGVILKRLQWAVAISLLVHVILCIAMHALSLEMPNAAVADELPGAPKEELSLPDYGGMETPDREVAPWQQTDETPAPQRDIDVERQTEAQLTEPEKPKPVDIERPATVAKLETPERFEPETALHDEAASEIERQSREPPAEMPRDLARPDVQISEVNEPELKDRVEQIRPDNIPSVADRMQIDVASADPRLESASVDVNRTDPKPQVSDQPAKFSERATSEPTAAASATEDVKLETTEARQPTAQEAAVDAPRRQSADVPSTKSSLAEVPAVSPRDSVGRARLNSAARTDKLPDATPSAGAATEMSRDTAPSGQAVDAEAGPVSVESATAATAPQVSASSAASMATHSGATTATLGAGDKGTGAVVGSSQAPMPTRGSGRVDRQSAGEPRLEQTESAAFAGGHNSGKDGGAVGTQIGEIAVPKTSRRASEKGIALATGPSNTSVSRQADRLPARPLPGTSGAADRSFSAGPARQSAVPRPAAGTGLVARATEPTARLGNDVGLPTSNEGGLNTSRITTDAKLPAAAVEAEQAGNLVFPGPQAQDVSGGSLSGPRMSSLPRRNAGLPGASGPSTSSTSSTASALQPSRLAVGLVRVGVGHDTPTLASETQVAGLIKQSVPGIGVSPEARMSASLSMRRTEARRDATKALGGSDASEAAVERGLVWLAEHQYADGHWSIHALHCQDHQCSGHGSFHADSAATGLALLAFLGAGYTHQSGQHRDVVDRGLKWQLQSQKPDGDLFRGDTEFVWFYSHGMAAIALCEAYGMTKDDALREPAQRALDFIVQSQNRQFGGWRYRPRFESDTSVSGWQLMALKSGQMAGLNVPKSAYDGVARWLHTVESKTVPGQFTYHPSRPANLAMTAEGLLMHQYLGARRDDPQLIAGANHLLHNMPDLNQRDAYFWYYATQVMFHMQGKYWTEWNAQLRDTLVSTQLKDGGSSGSWNPDRPTPEKWAAAGGRHYLTCLNLLMLEVYYRHLPLYVELGK